MSATEVHVRSIGHVSGRDDKSLPSIQLSVNFRVEQTYHSSDGSFKSNTRRDLISQISLQFPCEPFSITSDIISAMISRMNIPFPLHKLQYTPSHHHHHHYNILHQLNSLDDLITIILDDARWTVTKFSSFGRKLLRLDINIENRVILPSHEIEAMDQAKNMEQLVLQLHQYVSWIIRVNPGMDFHAIEEEIALAVSNTSASLDQSYEQDLRLSLMERAMREYLGYDRSLPASKSSIETLLETLKFEGNIDDTEEQVVCAICKDDMFIGSEVTRMPCSHTYHRDCILEWLKRSHMCPLCRFKLPTTSAN